MPRDHFGHRGFAGAGDIVTAGDGADTIVPGDWIARGASATVMDTVMDDDTGQGQ